MHFLKTPLFHYTLLQKAELNSPTPILASPKSSKKAPSKLAFTKPVVGSLQAGLASRANLAGVPLKRLKSERYLAFSVTKFRGIVGSLKQHLFLRFQSDQVVVARILRGLLFRLRID